MWRHNKCCWTTKGCDNETHDSERPGAVRTHVSEQSEAVPTHVSEQPGKPWTTKQPGTKIRSTAYVWAAMGYDNIDFTVSNHITQVWTVTGYGHTTHVWAATGCNNIEFTGCNHVTQAWTVTGYCYIYTQHMYELLWDVTTLNCYRVWPHNIDVNRNLVWPNNTGVNRYGLWQHHAQHT